MNKKFKEWAEAIKQCSVAALAHWGNIESPFVSSANAGADVLQSLADMPDDEPDETGNAWVPPVGYVTKANRDWWKAKYIELLRMLDIKEDELSRLQQKVAQLEAYKSWAEPQIARPVEQSVIDENELLKAELAIYKGREEGKQLIINQLENKCALLQQQLVELDHCRDSASKAEDLEKENERLRADAALGIVLKPRELELLIDFYDNDSSTAESVGADEVVAYDDSRIAVFKAQLTKEQPK